MCLVLRIAFLGVKHVCCQVHAEKATGLLYAAHDDMHTPMYNCSQLRNMLKCPAVKRREEDISNVYTALHTGEIGYPPGRAHQASP